MQQRVLADGFVPNSSKIEEEDQGVVYVAQRVEHPETGEVLVCHVPNGDRDQVT